MEINNIHATFHQSLRQFIISKINDPDDAEDILQEVFIKLASNLGSLKDREKLRSWIFTITRNAIHDYYRKQKKQPQAFTESLAETLPEETDNDHTKGLDKCLKSFISKLPDEYRNIIIDSEIRGIKQKELAEKYNLAYSSVRSRVQRGRSRLKEMLLNCCLIELDKRGNVLAAQLKNKNGNSCDMCN